MDPIMALAIMMMMAGQNPTMAGVMPPAVANPYYYENVPVMQSIPTPYPYGNPYFYPIPSYPQYSPPQQYYAAPAIIPHCARPYHPRWRCQCR